MINHLAVIMDWNRRWAKSKFLPKLAGYNSWANNVYKITNLAIKKWIKYLTLWWLSTDNFISRWKEEISLIIKIINSIEKYLEKMIKKWLKFEFIWDIEKLPKKTRKILEAVKQKTRENTWMVLTVALVYWGQDEIIRAIKKFIKNWWDLENLTSKIFRKYLDTGFLPEPDVIVRTWWNIRHSWFLLYDCAYSEYYFTKKYWPSFDEEELDKVIEAFKKTKRNFWK